MADILECVAAILWLALSIWSWVKFRRFNRRLDAVLSDIERDMSNGQ